MKDDQQEDFGSETDFEGEATKQNEELYPPDSRWSPQTVEGFLWPNP